MKTIQTTKAVVKALVATSLIFTLGYMSSAAPAPSTLAEANKLFDKQQWQAAERAYEVFSRKSSGAEKYEAQYKAAVCMEFCKVTGRAVSNFNQIIINAGALRDAPEIGEQSGSNPKIEQSGANPKIRNKE